MRAEKKLLTNEYVARLNASPFFIVVGYTGLKVAHLSELRKRLTKAGAEIHVVKNTVFSVAAKEAGIGELNGSLAGSSIGLEFRVGGNLIEGLDIHSFALDGIVLAEPSGATAVA